MEIFLKSLLDQQMNDVNQSGLILTLVACQQYGSEKIPANSRDFSFLLKNLESLRDQQVLLSEKDKQASVSLMCNGTNRVLGTEFEYGTSSHGDHMLSVCQWSSLLVSGIVW